MTELNYELLEQWANVKNLKQSYTRKLKKCPKDNENGIEYLTKCIKECDHHLNTIVKHEDYVELYGEIAFEMNLDYDRVR